MKTLYLDCRSGISGDMTVGALLDLGVPLNHLEQELHRLGLPENSWTLSATETERHHIRALKFDVATHDHHTHRHYHGIDTMIAASSLNDNTKETARRIFRRLAEAEARVHGVDIEKVHFHEVGAIDSIADIVGAAICIDYLCVDEVYASPLPLGSGFIESAHGKLPVPAPATAELMQGMPVHGECGEGERVTPTGAAILSSLVRGFGSTPSMTLLKTGCGAGGRDFPDCPNILRAFLGERSAADSHESVIEASCNLDDVSPETLGYLLEVLLAENALDAWFTHIQMKKNRPGVMLSFLCRPDELERLAERVMKETGSPGLRFRHTGRIVAERRTEERETPLGTVRFKSSRFGEKPEFDDCRRIAIETGLPLRDVVQSVSRNAGKVVA